MTTSTSAPRAVETGRSNPVRRSILIITESFDPHADLVQAESDRRGIPWRRIHLADFPLRMRASYFVDGRRTSAQLLCDGESLESSDIGAVWYRRSQAFGLPDGLTGDDRSFALRECSEHVEGLWQLLPEATWVSPPLAIRAASSKPLQLLVARELGFAIPSTCFSNDPAAVRSFFDAHPEGVVYKPHTPLMVHDGDGTVGVAYTRRLSVPDLQRLGEIVYSPGIFQAFVPKQYDVRVTVIGRRVFACRIDSQLSDDTRVDCRAAPWEGPAPPHVPLELPPKMAQRCRRLVDHLGLRFGAIDLAVDEGGRFQFFEINPNGQWAWIEQLTGLPLVEAFVDLLCGMQPDDEKGERDG